jgi:hypothetical protein
LLIVFQVLTCADAIDGLDRHHLTNGCPTAADPQAVRLTSLSRNVVNVEVEPQASRPNKPQAQTNMANTVRPHSHVDQSRLLGFQVTTRADTVNVVDRHHRTNGRPTAPDPARLTSLSGNVINIAVLEPRSSRPNEPQAQVNTVAEALLTCQSVSLIIFSGHDSC